MVRVKICGITNLEDARMVYEAGADAIGFVFYPRSKRYVSPEIARNIARSLPPFVCKIGVFVNEDPEKIKEIASFVGLCAVQLHGDEDLDTCKRVAEKVPVIKAIGVKTEEDVKKALTFREFPVLFDTKSDTRGGSGLVFDWNLLIPYRNLFDFLILAGGLNPENVSEAIKVLHPNAVDVSSGVESLPGKKDPAAVKLFIKKAKGTWEG